MATELPEQQNSHEEMTSKKRGLDECHDDNDDDNSRQSRRGSLPPLKKRHLNVPASASAEQGEDRVAKKEEEDLIANHPAIRAMNALKQGGKATGDGAISLSPEDIAARLQAFEEAQRRSNVSRELLAKATQELQRAKQLQQQERMVKLMALNAAMVANVNTTNSTTAAPAPSPDPAGRVAAARLSLGSCGSRSGSMGAAGTDLAAFGAAAMTGAAW